MVTLRHTVTLEPVPCDWFEAAVRAVVGAVEELRAERGTLLAGGEPVTGVRLTAGGHIGAGARYEIEDLGEGGAVASTHRVDVTSWDRSVIRLRYEGKSEELRVRGEGEMRGVDRPATVTCSGEFRGSGSGARYRSGRMKAALDLRAWWSAASGARPPLTADLRHPLAQATVHVTKAEAEKGLWKATVTVTARGRGWARLPAAVAAVLAGVALRRAYREGIDEFAQDWNAQVPAMLAHPPESLGSDFLTALPTGPADSSGNARPD